MEQELVEQGLDSVLFDVWQAIVLPMLSFADIFQLCGVTRHVRELLHNENTFRRLCENRYQISPYLKVSYIRFARLLCIATRVSSIHQSIYWTDVVDSHDRHDHRTVFKQRDRMIVQLSSLALTPPTTRAHTIMRTSPRLSESLINTLWLEPDVLCSYLPNLSTSLIEEKCGVGGQHMYSLEEVTSLLFEMSGSEVEYQTDILKKLEHDISETASYLPYVSRSCRLVEIAKCFESVARRDTTLLSSLKCENLIPTLPEHITTWWSYNPYDCLVVHEYSSKLSDDVLATQNWINFTAKVAELHSVLKLLIKGRLRVWQLEDYFMAVIEYDEFWNTLPQSSRPNRDVLYGDLGSYLLSTLPRSQREKKLTKQKLLTAMERCGKKTVDRTTTKVCCSPRVSSCVLL
ncbi:uncharacterized protein LOC135825067 [Sycon ciliatum]|uniref:uncharacterized protein LOC135825067 n=1 Tax=Sycon ciliatum TaxID=27933 RepID=UPI0031F6C328